MNTNFVIVVDYDENNPYLDDNYLLGWNNNYDWFDCDTVGDAIINSDSTIKNNEHGLIEIDRWTSVYVGETAEDCTEYCNAANKEDINCIVCRLVLDNEGQWTVVPV